MVNQDYNASALLKIGILTPVYQNEESFSIDKNLTKYSYKIYSNFGSDASLVLGLACYIQKNISKFSSDLFGVYEFKYEDFMKFYGVTQAYLFKQHSKPYIKKVAPETEDSFFTTILGNALFLLRKKAFNDFYLSRNLAGKKVEKIEDDHIFLKELAVEKIKNKNGVDKWRIQFSIDEKMESNIFKYFDRVDNKVFTNKVLRKNNLEALYLFLTNAYNVVRYNGENKFVVVNDQTMANSPFEFLSIIMQVHNISEFGDRKKAMFRKMKKLNEITSQNVILAFEASSTGKSNNQPFFTWENFTPSTKEERENLHNEAFNEYYRINLQKYWRKYHIGVTEVKHKISFEKWVEIGELDVKQKIDAYIDTYAELRGKKLTYTSEEVVMSFGNTKIKAAFQKEKFYRNQLGSE